MLTIDTISKSYQKDHKDIHVLSDYSLQVHAGDYIAIKGPSGCGKTTLLLITGGLLAPDSGSVVIDGSDFYQMTAEARSAFRASHIGFVFQQYHLIPYLTILENILAPGLARGISVTKDKAQELLVYFGLEHRAGHVPSELSVGEKQRTALARALINQPKLLLADEITGNLDEKNIEIVTGYLDDYQKQGGTIVLVTHDYNTANKAKKIIELNSK